MPKEILINIRAEDKATKIIQSVRTQIQQLGTTTAKASAAQQQQMTTMLTNVNKAAKSTQTTTVAQSKSLKEVASSYDTVGNKAKQSFAAQSHGMTAVMGQLESLGNKFRYLSLVFGLLSAAALNMSRSFIEAAREGEQAFLKLGVFAASAGENMDETTKVAQDFAKTGLIPLSQASEGLANLLATGLGLEKSKKLMQGFLNAAVVSKESLTDTYGDAVVKATLGTRIFQERQIDAIGVNTQLRNVFKIYGDQIDKNADQLTNAEKYQAIYNYYLKETSRFTGTADLVSSTFSGTLSTLGAQFFQMKQSLGNTLIPLIGSLGDVFGKVSENISEFASKYAGLTFVLLAGFTGLTLIVTSLATIGALLPLVTEGMSVFTGGLTAMAIAGIKFVVIGSLIAAAIGGITYAILKATGTWDKWMKKIADLKKKIQEVITPFQQLTDETDALTDAQKRQMETLAKTGPRTIRDLTEGLREWTNEHDKTISDLKSQIDDLGNEYDRTIAKINKSFSSSMDDMEIDHARKVEDITRQIDEEVSKGIWADQTKIRDLQLSLKRENEDYARSKNQKTEENQTQVDNETQQYNERLAKLKTQLEEQQKLEEEHAKLISLWRTLPYRDEVEKMRDTFNERMSDLADELKEVQNFSKKQTDSINDVSDAYSGVSNKINDVINSVSNLNSEQEQASKISYDTTSAMDKDWFVLGQNIGIYMRNALSTVTDVMLDIFTSAFQTIFSYIEKIPDLISSTINLIPGLTGFTSGLTGLDISGMLDKLLTPLKKLGQMSGLIGTAQAPTTGYSTSGTTVSSPTGTAIVGVTENGGKNSLIEGRFSSSEIPAMRSAYESILAGGSNNGYFQRSSTGEILWGYNAQPVDFAKVREELGYTQSTPDYSAYKISTNLEPGMSSPEVNKLQELMKKLGFFPKDIATTNYYGPITEDAVAAWQQSIGLDTGGYLGYFGPKSRAVFGFREGGIVPGMTGQAMPAIVHGGETILPAGVSPINININNPVVRKDSDIQAIAEQVKAILSRETFLKRFV